MTAPSPMRTAWFSSRWLIGSSSALEAPLDGPARPRPRRTACARHAGAGAPRTPRRTRRASAHGPASGPGAAPHPALPERRAEGAGPIARCCLVLDALGQHQRPRPLVLGGDRRDDRGLVARRARRWIRLRSSLMTSGSMNGSRASRAHVGAEVVQRDPAARRRRCPALAMRNSSAGAGGDGPLGDLEDEVQLRSGRGPTGRRARAGTARRSRSGSQVEEQRGAAPQPRPPAPRRTAATRQAQSKLAPPVPPTPAVANSRSGRSSGEPSGPRASAS